MINELDTVVLTHDIPEYNLQEDDIGAVVHCYEDGCVYEVEFISGEGNTIAVITLNSQDIRSMRPQEIIHVREVLAA